MTGRCGLAHEIEQCDWPLIAMDEPPGLRPAMVLRMARLLRQLDVDVVHTHNTKPLLYGSLAARLARVPVVLHTCHGQRYGSSGPHTFMFVQACRWADRIVCVSNDIAALRIREGIPREKICRVWNGVDLSRFAYLGPQAKGPAVLVARLRPEKDVETLLRATALVIEELPAFRLKIAGDGECSTSLRQMVDDLGMALQVEFLSEVHEVGDLLSHASLLVLPSLAEGISLSVLEAMAQGLPVVATNVGGNPEVVADGQTGLLVPPGDPTQLARAIVEIWKNPELGRRMGAAGRARVENNFNVRRMVANYEAIYEELSCATERVRRI